MISISAFKGVGTRFAGHGFLLAKKYSPEILTALGIAGGVTTVVLASKATLKLETVIDETGENVKAVKELYASEKDFPSAKIVEISYKKDLAKVYTHGVLDVVKLYGPTITLGLSSVFCVVAAHGIMQRRQVALIAAFNAVEKSFTEYRKRVETELGPKKAMEFREGFVVEEGVKEDEDGEKTAVQHRVPTGTSQYGRFFDQLSKQWDPIPDYNLTFLICQQNFANDLLQSRGHVFLNEIYDRLDLPRTAAGALVGWIRGEGDNYVDFGLHDGDKESVRKFVNGYEAAILLDFNVNGVIYDLI